MDRLALRETDPRYVRSFDPITRGPIAACALLALIGLAGAVVAPFRLIASLFRKDHARGR